jgi:hypothetical protein
MPLAKRAHKIRQHADSRGKKNEREEKRREEKKQKEENNNRLTHSLQYMLVHE